MGEKSKAFLKFLVFFSIGGIILFLLYRSQSQAFAEQCRLDGIPAEECNFLEKIISDFRSVNPYWLGLIILMYMASNISRALRWMMALKPLGYSVKFINALGTIMIGYFVNLGLPRVGEIVRPVTLARYEKIGVEKVIGTIVAERALDVFMFFLFVLLAFTLGSNELWAYISENQNIVDKVMPIVTNPWFYVLSVIFVFSGIMVLRSQWFAKSRLGTKISSVIHGFMDGIRSIFKIKNPALFIFHTIFIWIMYFLMTRVCFYAFEPTSALSLKAALMVFVFGSLGIVFPSPGGMGSYHAMIMAGLWIYGVDQGDGFSFANIIFFTIQLFCNVFFGGLAYGLLPLFNKNYQGAVSTENT